MQKYLKKCSFEERIFIYILFFTLTLPLILILENLIIGYPFVANYKWFATFVISFICLFLSLKTKHLNKIQFFVFFIYIFILLPFGCIYTGVNNHTSSIYAFLIYITVIYLFDGWQKYFYMLSIIILMLLMIYLNFQYPFLFLDVDSGIHFVDSIVQIFITFLLAGLLIGTFSNAYKKEKEVLKKYAQLLDEQNKELERISMTDELTKVYNRRYIFNYFNKLKNLQTNIELLIGMIDLDAFKQINDTYGHDVGDQVLIKISHMLKIIIGNNGLLGRYGGDEFIIIIEDINSVDYMDLIDKMSKISVIFSPLENPVTLSGGFVRYNGQSHIDEVLSRADALLYKVKDSGKNNLIVE